MGHSNSLPAQDSEEIQQERFQRSLDFYESQRRQKAILNLLNMRTFQNMPNDWLDWFTLPIDAITHIISFLFPDIHNMIFVSPLWYVKIHEGWEALMQSAEKSFAWAMSGYLLLRESQMSILPIKTVENQGYRIDRVISAEVLPKLAGKTIKLRWVYSLYGQEYVYKTEYIFDVKKQGTSRTVWLHRDDTSDDVTSHTCYTRQITTVCVGDIIEIAFSIYNLAGLIKFDSVSWNLPEIEEVDKITEQVDYIVKNPPSNMVSDAMAVYKRMRVLFTMRGCEVEANYLDWIDHRYYVADRRVFNFCHYGPFLKIRKIEYAGVNMEVWKITYKAMVPGMVAEFREKFGITIEVIDKTQIINEEIKRIGFLLDRELPIQVRKGDELILYISKVLN